MAARNRATSSNDGTLNDHSKLEMVCVNAPPATSLTMPSETGEHIRLDESSGAVIGSGPPTNDFLTRPPTQGLEGINRDYEVPNLCTYRKIEGLLEKMQDENTGLPIKSVKSFMSKIPSVFTGGDLIQWILKTLDVDDTTEALHLANLMSSCGYILPIEDHVLMVKNDGTFYRFQTPYFWPSNHGEPDNIDYAVYLCKRTMQNKTRLELADYEAENLARLQKLFARKWELIYMQAEAQIKVDKKRDKVERNVLDSQERAFWDVYRPAPGCVNMSEQDIKKLMRRKASFLTIQPLTNSHRRLSTESSTSAQPTSALAFAANKNLITMTVGLFTTQPSSESTSSRPKVLQEHDEAALIDQLCHEIEFLKHRIDRRCLKTSKVCEHYVSYFEQYAEFDPFITSCEPSNPWVTDSIDLWESEKMGNAKEILSRRVKRWSFSINELLKDPIGRDHFMKFLDKEYSSENLRFYEACIQLRFHTAQKDVLTRVNEIFNEFLSPGAYYSINIDQRVMNLTKNNMANAPSRYTFDEAQDHIFNLMNRDTYARFLRSDAYKELLLGGKKKPGLKASRLSIVARGPIEISSINTTTSILGSSDKHSLGVNVR